MQDYRNLAVWKKAHAFTLKIYGVTETFPKIETFGLAPVCARVPHRFS
jgi:hypothetical protein